MKAPRLGTIGAGLAGAALGLMVLATGGVTSILLIPAVALPAIVAAISTIGAWSAREYLVRGAVVAVTFTVVAVSGIGEPATGFTGFLVLQWVCLALMLFPAKWIVRTTGKARPASPAVIDARADRRRRERELRESRQPATRRPS